MAKEVEIMKLKPGEHVVCAWAEPAAGPGWGNARYYGANTTPPMGGVGYHGNLTVAAQSRVSVT